MKVELDPVPLVRINCPEFFAASEFRLWLDHVASVECAKSRNFPTATWHVSGELPNEMSDIFIVVDGADGSDSDMPTFWWNRLQNAVRAVLSDPPPECLVWLTNLDESHVPDNIT